MGNYINEALLDASPMKKQKEESKALVSKWDKTGLLEGLNTDFQKSGMAQLLENQARELISENSRTSPTGGSDEEWSGVALPLVRRIFGEVVAQDFVSVQPMNLPSGLVFYLDFKYGSNRFAHNTDKVQNKTAGGDNSSIFGKTGNKTPEGATSPFGEGGLYGAGRYGYTANTSSAVIANQGALSNTVWTTGSIDVAADLFHDSEFSASAAAGGNLKSGSGDFTSHYFKVTINTGSLTNVDLSAIKSFGLSGSAGAAIKQWYPQFTKLDNNSTEIDFIVSGSGVVATADLIVDYYVQPTDVTRGDFEDTEGSAVNDFLAIPEVDLQLNSLPIVAKTRKLKAVWTPELAQDLNAYHSVDAEAELTSMLSEYISQEIDLEILDMLIADATTTDYWSAKAGYDYNSSTTSFENNTGSWFGTRFEWWQTLVAKMQKVSNEIHKLTLRGGANFAVCSPKVSTILESLPGYSSSPGADASVQNFSAGISKVGAVDSRFSIYKNPYQNDNVILVGFRGNNFLETGAVYAPYVPLIMTPLVYDPSDFTPRKGVMTRYAKKMIRPEFYGKIYLSDLNLI